MRESWATRMAEIITPGTGLLIALQHPLDKSIFHSEDTERGPPFLLTPEMYILFDYTDPDTTNYSGHTLKGFILRSL
jgi:hypothetical protein